MSRISFGPSWARRARASAAVKPRSTSTGVSPPRLARSRWAGVLCIVSTAPSAAAGAGGEGRAARELGAGSGRRRIAGRGGASDESPKCASAVADSQSIQNASLRSGVSGTRTEPVSSWICRGSTPADASRAACTALRSRPRTRTLAQRLLQDVITAWRSKTGMEREYGPRSV